MVDLGLYNFVKNKRDAGESKEQVLQDLAKSGWNAELIEEAWEAVAHNKVPQTSHPKELLHTRYSTNTSVTIFGVLLVIIAGYFAFTAYEKATSSSGTLTPSQAFLSGSPTLQPYSEPGVDVTMDVPANWQMSALDAPDGTVDGFSATQQSNSNTLSAKIEIQVNTLTLTGVIAERGSTLNGNSAIKMIQDKDVTIGGQPGHVFEYITNTPGGTLPTHTMEAYVMDPIGNLFVFTATSLDLDWGSVPATQMINSISFAK